MGSRGEHEYEEPQHLVKIAHPFHLARFSVTQQEFSVFANTTGIEPKFGLPAMPDHPADNVDWRQARDFCEWLNQACRDALPSGHIARLPTEAEWEYACRAGTETEYSSGDGEATLLEVGWFGVDAPHRVGEKSPNEFGLFDMHGNVWEWCRDAYDKDAYKKRVNGIIKPEVQNGGKGQENLLRVVRGGSFADSAWLCRAASRLRRSPTHRSEFQGFRVGLFLNHEE